MGIALALNLLSHSSQLTNLYIITPLIQKVNALYRKCHIRNSLKPINITKKFTNLQ